MEATEYQNIPERKLALCHGLGCPVKHTCLRYLTLEEDGSIFLPYVPNIFTECEKIMPIEVG